VRINERDACPCGSGFPAAECCIQQSEPIPGFGLQGYPERFAVGWLLSGSEQFARFYESERHRITGDLTWAEDTGLPTGVAARATCNSAGSSVIRLREMPAPVEHAQLIAHELGHFLIDLDGFPALAARPDLDWIAAPLNSMLHDPLVGRLLGSHGFDIRAAYDAEVADARVHLDPKPIPPESSSGQLIWTLNYVSKRLDWDVVKDAGDSDCDGFCEYFRHRYPLLADTGDRVYELIQRVGFDTPTKMATVLSALRECFELSDGFHVRFPEGGQFGA